MRSCQELPVWNWLLAALGPDARVVDHSRNSLREAVKALELIRILDVRQGDGTYVTSLEPRLLLEAMSFVVDLHQDQSVIEMSEVRRALEPYAASLAACEISDEQLASLGALLDSVDETTSVEDLVAHDIEFHRQITAASGNAYLSSLLDALSSTRDSDVTRSWVTVHVSGIESWLRQAAN